MSELPASFDVGYASGGPRLRVRPIKTWVRGEVTPISGGSGLKDYVKNLVYLMFERNAEIDAVVMVRAGGPPFMLRRAGAVWFDAEGRQVVIGGGR